MQVGHWVHIMHGCLNHFAVDIYIMQYEVCQYWRDLPDAYMQKFQTYLHRLSVMAKNLGRKRIGQN